MAFETSLRGSAGPSRRTLLVGGGVGVGLLLAWGLWPRSYAPNLRAAEGETIFNGFLKIGRDGRVIVAVPQAELGQGVYTSLPQILADELGADWRTIGVEPAPISPLYANHLIAEEEADASFPEAIQGTGRWIAQEYATRNALMVTGGSTSIRTFETRMREAGAAARALLSKAAAKRWKVDWEELDTRNGFVVNGRDRIPFGELAEAAARHEVPENLPIRGGVDNRLVGQSLPRLDLPSKVDGTAQFAADIRLSGMVFASVRAGPIGGGRLIRADKGAADKIPGVLATFENPAWIGAAATNWWAANRAVEAMKPAFQTDHLLVSSDSIDAALWSAMERGEASRIFAKGDIAAAYAASPVFRTHYLVGPSPSAALETLTATARFTGDRLEVWAPTQAPAFARSAAARAAGISENRVTIHRTFIGGGYGRKLETSAIEQAVFMAAHLKRPVQLVWSRIEEVVQDGFRPPALATLSASMASNGLVTGWQARIVTPATRSQVTERLRGGVSGRADRAERFAVEGAVPPYRIPAVAIDHLPADVGLKTGMWRSGAHSYTAFFTESFLDELSRKAGIEPLSFRMQMLGENPRLARCLSTAAALGGWDGGAPGSSMGIAAHSCFGSHVAILVEVQVDKSQRVKVDRAVCAVDCGRMINPDIVRQQIEGGIIHGIAAATGNMVNFENGLPDMKGFEQLVLPRLAGSPEITVELIENDEDSGGVTELGVPAVAPAIANAVFASTGQRLRSLPFVIGGA